MSTSYVRYPSSQQGIPAFPLQGTTDGTSAVPTYSWLSEVGLGFFRDAAGGVQITSSNATQTRFSVFNTTLTGNSKLTLVTASGSTGDSVIEFLDAGDANLWSMGRDDSVTNEFALYYGTGGLGTGTKVFGVSSTALGIQARGTNTNDAAAAGFVGEIVTAESAGLNAATTTQFGDVTNISLTAGDWDISVNGEGFLNTATGLTAMGMGIGTASGNSSTGQVAGINFHTVAPATAAYNSMVTIADYQVSLSGTTTYYLKMYAVYSGGTPQFRGRIMARRRR